MTVSPGCVQAFLLCGSLLATSCVCIIFVALCYVCWKLKIKYGYLRAQFQKVREQAGVRYALILFTVCLHLFCFYLQVCGGAGEGTINYQNHFLLPINSSYTLLSERAMKPDNAPSGPRLHLHSRYSKLFYLVPLCACLVSRLCSVARLAITTGSQSIPQLCKPRACCHFRPGDVLSPVLPRGKSSLDQRGAQARGGAISVFFCTLAV
jgi:hypothetical protein